MTPAVVREVLVERAAGVTDGKIILTDVPVVPKDATGDLREGIQRRRDAALTGTCVCGAVRRPLTRRERRRGGLVHIAFDHRRSCPAHSDVLGPLIDAWATAE